LYISTLRLETRILVCPKSLQNVNRIRVSRGSTVSPLRPLQTSAKVAFKGVSIPSESAGATLQKISGIQILSQQVPWRQQNQQASEELNKEIWELV
jgi:hypothetical protein